MKLVRFPLMLSLLLTLTLPMFSQVHQPEQQDYSGLLGTNPDCAPPYGYTWSCGYSCNTLNGACLCAENDNPSSICMKSSAGTGCGCFDHSCDACCTTSSCF
jgi:hypothetical protein